MKRDLTEGLEQTLTGSGAIKGFAGAMQKLVTAILTPVRPVGCSQ